MTDIPKQLAAETKQALIKMGMIKNG